MLKNTGIDQGEAKQRLDWAHPMTWGHSYIEQWLFEKKDKMLIGLFSTMLTVCIFGTVYASVPKDTVPKVFTIAVLDMSPENAPVQMHDLAFEKLKEGLLKTKVFAIFSREETWVFKAKSGPFHGLQELKDCIKKLGTDVKIEKVLAVGIKKAKEFYEVEILFFDINKKEKDIWDRRQFFLQSELSKLMEDYAFKVAELSYGDLKERIFFSSVFVPGLGQFISGKKLRGAAYLAAILGLSVYTYSLSRIEFYTGGGRIMNRIDDDNDGVIDRWLIGYEEVTEEEWMDEYQRRHKAEEDRDRVKTLKATTLGVIGAIYAWNLVDAILIGRQYGRQQIRQRRFSLTADPNPENPKVLLTWRVDF